MISAASWATDARWPTHAAATEAPGHDSEEWDNRQGRHPSLGYRRPVKDEQYLAAAAPMCRSNRGNIRASPKGAEEQASSSPLIHHDDPAAGAMDGAMVLVCARNGENTARRQSI